jgi:DNA-binding FadR family transcriptional regulator
MPLAPFESVNAPKLASVVAQRIEDEVVALGWPVGTVLGSETELLERFGVSRAVLREAARIVEHTGAARMRRGPGGGLVVAQPNRDAVAAASGIWFSYVGVSVSELVEARVPLLAQACQLAADHVDEAGIERLRAYLARMDAEGELDAEAFNTLDRLLADLSGNPALALFVQAIGDIGLSRLNGTRARLDPPPTEADARRHLDGYRRVAEAVVRGDGGAARTVMTELVEAVGRRLRDRPARPRRGPVALDPAAGKLAERVAAALRDDIERAGWPVGDVLGSETDLIERYGVSRAILRAAVRILEHHGAVRTKRGPGGGLVVTAPDQEAIVRAARIALEYERVTPKQLVDARAGLEVACVRLAAERRTPDLVAGIERAFAEEVAAGDAAVLLHALHRDFAAAGGNRPLMLFVDVLTQLSAAHVRPGSRSADGLATMAAEVHRAHARIIEAVVAGDAALAERRMVRHLSASADVLI